MGGNTTAASDTYSMSTYYREGRAVGELGRSAILNGRSEGQVPVGAWVGDQRGIRGCCAVDSIPSQWVVK